MDAARISAKHSGKGPQRLWLSGHFLALSRNAYVSRGNILKHIVKHI